jgi:hypothetical protein
MVKYRLVLSAWGGDTVGILYNSFSDEPLLTTINRSRRPLAQELLLRRIIVARSKRGCRMFKFKKHLPSLLGGLAAAALINSVSVPVMADEIYFGNITPSSGLGTAPACTHVSGDGGFVCSNGQTFTSGGSTFTATGFAGPAQFTNPSALTWKPVSAGGVTNDNDESGLGENAIGPQSPAQACTDNPGGGGASTPCEVGVNASVTVASTVALTDVLIGSVQDPERFQIWTGPDAAHLTDFTGTIGLSSSFCQQPPPDGSGAEECLITGLPAGTTVVGLYHLAGNPTTDQSDTLITAVSLVPAPLIGHGLLALLAVGGVLFGAKLLERSKKLGRQFG